MANVIADLFTTLLRALASWVDRCLPVYEPNVWNDATQGANNCYNYGTNIKTNTYAQPGEAHGIFLTQADCVCPKVHAAAVADGLVPVGCDDGCGCDKCHHQVALVMAPGYDYHWYRKDKDGKWSHKVGGSPATNLDNAGNPISDPRTADRGVYTVFCGCYCVDKSVVVIT